jgi:cell division protein FtsI (penicillin-binding protein 3)
MRHGNSLGLKIALVCLLLNTPWALAGETAPQPVTTTSLALNADAAPSQRIITDRNGVLLDAATTPALTYFHPGKIAEDQPLQLSLEAKSNKILDEELASGLQRFSAKAAAGFIMDVNTGEIIALSSIESGNSQPQATTLGGAPPNRVTEGVYEIGSSAKLMTIAMALDAGKVSLASRIDARELHYGGFVVYDPGPHRQMMALSKVMQQPANSAVGRLALRIGTTGQKAFLGKMGQLERLEIEGIDAVAPNVPKKWTELETITTAYGCGLAVSPLQAGMAIAAMANGGIMLRPTIFKRSEQAFDATERRVISPDTSAKMRDLLRLNVEEGTAKKADVAGYFVGGVTSTAEKVVNGEYDRNRVITTFTAVFPADKPKYLVMTLLDEPQALRETYGFITAGWNAVPVAAKVIERTAPILGVELRATSPAARTPM